MLNWLFHRCKTLLQLFRISLNTQATKTKFNSKVDERSFTSQCHSTFYKKKEREEKKLLVLKLESQFTKV